MANTAAEIVWITHLLQELHALPPDRPTLLCDNKSALFMSQNPISHKRAKHIDLDYHFIRELVASDKLYTKFIPTKLQVADIFTKSLPRPQTDVFQLRTKKVQDVVGTTQGIKNGDDMPLLRTITDIFGQPIWFKAIVFLTHAATAPPEGPKDHEER
ncbi:uncharacterized mitochondrial protein-like protein [Tanacetum coccineum]